MDGAIPGGSVPATPQTRPDQKGITVSSSHDPALHDEPELEDDCDVSLGESGHSRMTYPPPGRSPPATLPSRGLDDQPAACGAAIIVTEGDDSLEPAPPPSPASSMDTFCSAAIDQSIRQCQQGPAQRTTMRPDKGEPHLFETTAVDILKRSSGARERKHPRRTMCAC